MTTHTQPSDNATWFSNTIKEQLESPYIHFNQPSIPGLRLGHGPVDLFSTKYSNNFGKEATGTINEEKVDHGELKNKLLAVQSHFNPATAQFTPSGDGDNVKSQIQWVSKDNRQYNLTAEGTLGQGSGHRIIQSLSLSGDPSVFTKQDSTSK